MIEHSLRRQLASTNARLLSDEITRRETNAQQDESSDFPWNVRDSYLDSEPHSFASWFKCVLPSSEVSLTSYIEQTLAPIKVRNGLELGGPGSNLFASFPFGYFSRTIGISLTDTRIDPSDTTATAEKIANDKKRNHQVISGNILDTKAKEQISTELGSPKAALIIERLYDGINTLPEDPFSLGEELRFWYDTMLARGGLFFAQVPPVLVNYLEEWQAVCKSQRDDIDVAIGTYKNNPVVRMHKLTDAPLPLLHPRDVLPKEKARQATTVYHSFLM